MRDKQTIAVLFGGQSPEHEVSCVSASNIIKLIDTSRYELVLIGITKEGKWLKVKNVNAISDGSWREGKIGAVLSPDATQKCIMVQEESALTKMKVDIVFPVIHGECGEDGTIQGLCELAKIPYVGCGVFASAVGMDKAFTKIVASHLGVEQASYEVIYRHQLKNELKEVVSRIEKRFSYPVFIKPANAGSSRGISKATDHAELMDGLKEADRYDKKIIVEEMIVGHEVECAVLGGGVSPVRASGVGEILAAASFYDYDAKYNNAESKTVIGPQLPGNAATQIPEIAKKIFIGIDGYGLARVDFFVTEEGDVIFNEINTMPGFTSISMYPMLWEAAGVTKKDLVQQLIDLAVERV